MFIFHWGHRFAVKQVTFAELDSLCCTFPASNGCRESALGDISSCMNPSNLNQKTNSTDFLFTITHFIICRSPVVIFLVLLQENYLCACFVACKSSTGESEGTQTEAGASAVCFYFFLCSAVCFLTLSTISSGLDPKCRFCHSNTNMCF